MNTIIIWYEFRYKKRESIKQIQIKKNLVCFNTLISESLHDGKYTSGPDA